MPLTWAADYGACLGANLVKNQSAAASDIPDSRQSLEART